MYFRRFPGRHIPVTAPTLPAYCPSLDIKKAPKLALFSIDFIVNKQINILAIEHPQTIRPTLI